MKNLDDFQFNNIVDPGFTNQGFTNQGFRDGKVCFFPVNANRTKCDRTKKPASPIKVDKSAFFFEDYTETGLDNPAYFDAIKIRKEERATTKKKKFSSLGGIVPDKTSSAKLTKVPGLNIWRLDFSKADTSSLPRRTTSWYRFAVTVSMIFVLILLICGIAVIVHAVKGGLIFGIPWFPFENGDPDVGVNKVAAHFRIMNRYFTSDLSNTSSEAYNQLTAELKLSLDIIFMDSTMGNYYNISDEFIFTNGSVVVECIIHLTQPVLEGAQNVGFAFLKALEQGKGILPPGRLYVDVHTVRFAAAMKQIDENILQDLQGLEPWTEWSSCTINGVCDAMQMQVRRRKCSGSPVQLCVEDTEIVETKPCTCQATLAVSSLMFSRTWSEWTNWSLCPELHQCDRHNIQKRTRICLGTGGKAIPNFLCSRGTGAVGTQIRHCLCSQTKK